jgi:hypothetical protein
MEKSGMEEKISEPGRDSIGLITEVVVQGDKEASQARDYCVAKNAPHRAARPDPSRRKKRLLGMTIKLSHYPITDYGFTWPIP